MGWTVFYTKGSSQTNNSVILIGSDDWGVSTEILKVKVGGGGNSLWKMGYTGVPDRSKDYAWNYMYELYRDLSRQFGLPKEFNILEIISNPNVTIIWADENPMDYCTAIRNGVPVFV